MLVLNSVCIKSLAIASLKCFIACQLHQSAVFASQQKSMMCVKQKRFGPAEELYIVEQDKPHPNREHIGIKVVSTALNRADLLLRQGKYPGQKDPLTLGLEVSGFVETLGDNCTKFRLGDKVMALLPGGGYASHAIAHERHTMHVPNDVDMLHAGGIPETWLTAYQLIHFVGQLKKDELVLVHGGGSGVGTAAIQLISLVGAEAIVTAGTPAKLDMALKLGAAAAFNYKEGEFMDKVLKHTNGKGVNLILDCVGSSFWQQNIACLAMDGRWVVYGLMGGRNIDGPLLGQILGKRASLLGTTLKSRSNDYKASLVEAFSVNALPHFSGPNRKLVPVIDKVFPLKCVVDAHKYMESNKSNGKIILNVRDISTDCSNKLSPSQTSGEL